MWDLIVSVTDHCLSFYFKIVHLYCWCQENLVSQKNKIEKIIKKQLSPPVTP